MERCLKYFLLLVLVFKEEFSLWDDLIYIVVVEVMYMICEMIVKIWVYFN